MMRHHQQTNVHACLIGSNLWCATLHERKPHRPASGPPGPLARAKETRQAISGGKPNFRLEEGNGEKKKALKTHGLSQITADAVEKIELCERSVLLCVVDVFGGHADL